MASGGFYAFWYLVFSRFAEPLRARGDAKRQKDLAEFFVEGEVVAEAALEHLRGQSEIIRDAEEVLQSFSSSSEETARAAQAAFKQFAATLTDGQTQPTNAPTINTTPRKAWPKHSSGLDKPRMKLHRPGKHPSR